MRDHRLKILLVEDNPGDARLIRETLAEAAPGGAEVEWVGQLSAATKRLEARGIDVVLLDLDLPDSQGLDTLVLASATAPDIPFVVLTGREDETTALAAVSKGAQDYIVKGDRKGEALVRALRYAIERKRTGEALLRSEERFRSLAATAPDAIISMGADQRIQVFNKAAERIFGYSTEEIVGQRIDRLIPPEYRDRHAGAIGRYLETGEARILGKVVELTGLRKGGEAFPVALSVSATGSGAEVTFTGIIRDIAEQKRAEGALRETRDYLEKLFRYANAPIIVWDPALRITRFNGAFERLTGYGAPEVLGRELSLLFPEASREESLRKTTSALGGEFWEWVEIPILKKDGATRLALWNSANIYAEDGTTVTATIAQGVDITERRRAEEQLRQSEKLAALGELLAGVAHELNNPLSVVLGQALLLQRSAAGGPAEARAAKILQAAERCARIVRNFLALARQYPPERQQMRLNPAVTDVLELLAYQLRVDSVEVRLDLTPDLPELWADPHQLHQVLVNLITNGQHAMRESPPPRRLTLRTSHEPREDVVCLEVTDTGPGIPPEVQTRIFDPFFTTKPPGQGTGLGLSLSRGIVEAHGGTIAVESRSGQGAAFRVRLPVIAGPVAEKEAGAPEAAAPVRGEAILVVDDEPEIAALLADILAAGGQEVETAANGALALDKLGKRAYGAILSDIKMPELDGPGLYRELERRHPDLASRVIFLTGDTLAPGTAEFLGRTGAPVLTKPFRVEEVIRVVQRVLQRGTREPLPGYGRPRV